MQNPYPTLRPNDLLPYGRVRRSHGYQGELQVTLTSPQLTEAEPDFIFVVIDEIPVPLQVESIRGSADRWIIKFDSIKNLSEAEPLIGCQLLIHKNKLPKDYEASNTSITGYTLLHPNKAKEIGTIIDLDTSTANTLLLVELATNQKEVAIPLVEEWIQSIDYHHKTITLHFPLDLLSL